MPFEELAQNGVRRDFVPNPFNGRAAPFALNRPADNRQVHCRQQKPRRRVDENVSAEFHPLSPPGRSRSHPARTSWSKERWAPFAGAAPAHESALPGSLRSQRTRQSCEPTPHAMHLRELVTDELLRDLFMVTVSLLFFSGTHAKRSSGAILFLIRLTVRAAPFALLRNTLRRVILSRTCEQPSIALSWG